MSLRLKKPKPSSNKFDTVELIQSADNYGKPSSRAKRSLPTFTENPSTNDNLSTAISMGDDNDDPNVHIDKKLQPIDKNDPDELDDDEQHHGKAPAKFGTFDGVLGRCLLCMWGVIMFLRTGWIVGNAGVWQATMVMVLSASITMFTTLSLSAICTNGEISHGGPYFLISRSLGPQFGGVIGLLFAVGNCVGVALHLVGFSEAITSLYSKSFFFGWDIQLIAEIGLFFLLLIALRGVGSIIKFNLLLLALMMISIIAFFIGTFIPSDSKTKVGYTGYSSKTFAENWNADYLPGYSFLAMVAIFFPSVTGCMAGANISGDLKNPAVNIPVGTITAVIFSMVVYIIIAWMLGACVQRQVLDDNGDPMDEAGLYYNYVIMSDISLWRPLVDMGIYASTFSSATSCFVAAPRIFKAVCDDGLFPIFSFFSVGRASDGEPVRCYILCLIICFIVILPGDINVIAPMVTNFFLITYALVNYSVFAWDLSKSPGWRPSFKYYSPYLALFATIQSVVLMFLIDWVMAFCTLLIGAICYKYIDSRNVNVNWGTTVESALYLKACKIALKYQTMNTEHAKIARPTFLIMLYDKNQNDVKILFNLAKYINYSQGLIQIGHVLIGDLNDENTNKQYLLKRKSYQNYDLPLNILKQCIMECCISDNYEDGTKAILQLAGMGGMKPNVFMIKHDNSSLKLSSSTLASDAPIPLWFSNLKSALLTGCGIMMIDESFSVDSLSFDNNDDIDVNKSSASRNEHIDIWWLFDDGGLTILTGYLLTKHKKFKNCKLRIMALNDIGFAEHTEMIHLMDKLRIEADINPVDAVDDDDVDDINDDDIYKKIFDDAVDQKINDNDIDIDNDDDIRPKKHIRKVSQFAKEKIMKYRRVGNTIEKYSSDSKLCLLTMPFPRSKFEWYEYSQIIHDLKPKNIPTIFIRGSEDQVLTFCF